MSTGTAVKLYATTQEVNGHKTVLAEPGSIWETKFGYVPLEDLPKGKAKAEAARAAKPEPSPEAGVPEWTVKKFSPEAYLRRFPNGPNAELARRIVGG